MHITQEVQGDVLILTPLLANLDATVSNDFKEKIAETVRNKNLKKVVLDIYNIHFIDSAGLGCLLSILRTLKSEGVHLKFVKINKAVVNMFELVSMHKIFETYSTLAEALAAFKKHQK